MSNVIQFPVIAGVEITTDDQGRFNLNALHKASGLGKAKQPANWLRLETTEELIDQLSKSSDLRSLPISSVAGRFGGTFAVEQLAVAYANWISASFYLTVINAFIDLKKGILEPSPSNMSRMEILQLAMEAEKENNVLRLENKKQTDKIEKLENFFQSGMTITAFGKMLNGVNCTQMNNYCLNELDWIYNESRSGKNRRFRAKSKARDRYLTETNVTIGLHGADPFTKNEPKLLQDGAKKLYQLYLDGELPMKKTWNGEFSHIKFLAEAS